MCNNSQGRLVHIFQSRRGYDIKNNGFTTEETISTEDKLLNSIKQNSQINIYDKLGKVLTNITVDSVSTVNSVSLYTEYQNRKTEK